MRDYGKVFSRIWESLDFRSLTEDGRTLVLYLLTCQHGTIAGVFRVPDGYACEDLQWGSERVEKGFADLFAKGFATRCGTSKWVWVTKFLEWNPPENPNQRKSAAKIASAVPDGCAWKREFMRVCGPLLGLEWVEPKEPLPNGSGTVPQPVSGAVAGTVAGAGTEGPSAAAAAAAEPLDPQTKTELWAAGKSLLETQGMPAKQCGSFVGKLVADYGDQIVIQAVRTAVVKRPADVAEYLVGTCKSMAAGGSPKGGRITDAQRQDMNASADAEAKRLLAGGRRAAAAPAAEVIDG